MKAFWNKICRIFVKVNNNVMATHKSQTEYIRATNDGQLYITKSDFLRDEKIQKTIEDFKKSSVYQQITERKQAIAAKSAQRKSHK